MKTLHCVHRPQQSLITISKVTKTIWRIVTFRTENEMQNAKKYNQIKKQSPIQLVDCLDVKNKEDRSWFRDFLKAIFSSPDLDYSQFVQLESKKTRHQIELNRWY